MEKTAAVRWNVAKWLGADAGLLYGSGFNCQCIKGFYPGDQTVLLLIVLRLAFFFFFTGLQL